QLLIAHEVAHTVQQRGGAAHRQNKLEVSTPGDSAEREADAAASAMVRGAPTQVGYSSGLMREASGKGGVTLNAQSVKWGGEALIESQKKEWGSCEVSFKAGVFGEGEIQWA